MASPQDYLDGRYAARTVQDLRAIQTVGMLNWWVALTGMPAQTPQEILSQAGCFECLPPGDLLTIQTQLLADILVALDPGADVTPDGIMERASCFACLPPGNLQVIQAVATVEAAEAS